MLGRFFANLRGKNVYFRCPTAKYKIRRGIFWQEKVWVGLKLSNYYDQPYLTGLEVYDTYGECYDSLLIQPEEEYNFGRCSSVSRLTSDIVKKTIKPGYGSVKKEVEILQLLNILSKNHFPKLLNFSLENNWYTMSYEGERINEIDKFPCDWDQQCWDIAEILSCCGINQQDIHERNILVNIVGNINLIDFGETVLDKIYVRPKSNFKSFQKNRLYPCRYIRENVGEDVEIITADTLQKQRIPQHLTEVLRYEGNYHGKRQETYKMLRTIISNQINYPLPCVKK